MDKNFFFSGRSMEIAMGKFFCTLKKSTLKNRKNAINLSEPASGKNFPKPKVAENEVKPGAISVETVAKNGGESIPNGPGQKKNF